jgi:hypothetical protein
MMIFLIFNPEVKEVPFSRFQKVTISGKLGNEVINYIFFLLLAFGTKR